MPANPSTPWSTRLHALWRSASDAMSTKGFSEELYFGLLSLPGACGLIGARFGLRGEVQIVRWADHDGLVTSPVGLAEQLLAWTAAHPERPTESVLTPLDELRGQSADLADRVAATGATGLLVTWFEVSENEWGLLGLAVSTPDVHAAPADAVGIDIVTAIRQATDVIVAADHHITERRALDDQQARDAILAEASLRMDASLDIEDTLRAVVRMAVPGLADGAAIHAERDGRMALIAVAHVDARREQRLGEHLRAGRWAGGPVVLGTDSSSWEEETRMSGLPDEVGLELMTISVLRARGRVVGMLAFFHRDGGPRRPRGAFLRDLAGRAALSIDNATLYERRRRDALSLQQHLLPTVLPDVPGLEFATTYNVADHTLEVGGDFYGAVDQSGGRVTALIGDVCGRGAPAAALTGLARHTLETVLAEGRSAQHAVRTLNDKMLRIGVTRFLTLATATFWAAESGFRVRTLSAGHPPTLLVRRDGAVRESRSTGRLVGVLPDLRLRTATDVLRPGDALVMYTDGLIEARDEEGRFFGDTDLEPTLSRLRGLPLPDLASSLIAGSGRYHVGDDAAVLAIRCTGERALRAELPPSAAGDAALAALRGLRGDSAPAELPERLVAFLAECALEGVGAVRVAVDGDAGWARVEITGEGRVAWAELTD
ncbi:PP2C family protein-serine/threonine phosphatase [Actinosynnema mirum]|uniref:Protein serine/threonine phosphatase n=2 Tax=Actinosynnema TaxID=40566 RepID=C6WQH9_ACTMD|nr:SpoIIE family protein phosphatase [Actinosynnema mirum]ACU36833.1 protein serine/threonine phosphatase [Actinosynnema mirum DSM 43827]AXX30301.1 Serine phosphatase RsbU, regulator of sigma subunit [Actinosynnema pretiosum subsp. pretiosum]